MYIYGSYRKIKTGVPLFWTTRYVLWQSIAKVGAVTAEKELYSYTQRMTIIKKELILLSCEILVVVLSTVVVSRPFAFEHTAMLGQYVYLCRTLLCACVQGGSKYKKAQLSLTNPRDACEKFARLT